MLRYHDAWSQDSLELAALLKNGQMLCDVLIPNINCDHSPRIEGWRNKG